MLMKSIIAVLFISLVAFVLIQLDADEVKLPALNLKKTTSLKQWNLKFDAMIKLVVKKEGHPLYKTNLVDYKSLVNDKSFDELGKLLKSIGTEKANEKEKLATWLNIYNYLAMKKVVDNIGIKKLTDLNKGFKTVWKQDAGIINGVTISLDTVEHKIVRARFKEPRVHFALVCAALSCPDLRIEAYQGDILDDQLKDQLSVFMKNSQKGLKIDDEKKTLHLTKIMKWFSGDFGKVPEWLEKQGVITKEQAAYKIKYLDYNWNLNALNK